MKEKKIVVIEDEQVVTELIRFLLEQEGWVVVPFTDRTGVMAYLQKESVQLVLLDLALGGQDGLGICEQVKADHRLREIPVVLMSAHRDLENIAGSCEADGFITKPFELGTFAKTVEGFIL